MLGDYSVHLVKIVYFLDGWLVNDVIYFIIRVLRLVLKFEANLDFLIENWTTGIYVVMRIL